MGRVAMNETKAEDIKKTGDKGNDPRQGSKVTKEKKSGPKKANSAEKVDSHDSGWF